MSKYNLTGKGFIIFQKNFIEKWEIQSIFVRETIVWNLSEHDVKYKWRLTLTRKSLRNIISNIFIAKLRSLETLWLV